MADFVQTQAVFPGGTSSTGWYQDGTMNVGGYVYDYRGNSSTNPTYGQMIYYSDYYPTYRQDISSVSAKFSLPTLTLSLSPGLTKHKLYAYFDFGSFYVNSVITRRPSGGLTGNVTDFSTPQPAFYADTYGPPLNFSGTITGTFTFWQNGGVVGKLPFTNLTTSKTRSAASLVFNTWATAGLVISGKGGGLQVATPFGGGATDSLPSIEVSGLIDYATVDIQCDYQNASSPGGFYCGIISTN